LENINVSMKFDCSGFNAKKWLKLDERREFQVQKNKRKLEKLEEIQVLRKSFFKLSTKQERW